MKIYVASSWRNETHPEIVMTLRRGSHDVYDFRNPPNKSGFAWKQVNPWYVRNDFVTAVDQRTMTDHPIAMAGYSADLTALQECDACVYVLPCGRSASWEFGYAMGQGKSCYVVWFGMHEPELMFREAKILGSMGEVCEAFGVPQ